MVNKIIENLLTENPAAHALKHANELYKLEKEKIGPYFSSFNVGITNCINAFYSLALLVKDLFLTVITFLLKWVNNKKYHPMFYAQMGYVCIDAAAIPLSFYGILYPENALFYIKQVMVFTMKVFAGARS